MKKTRYNLKQAITMTLRPDVIRRVDEIAERKYQSRSQVVEAILREYFLGVADNGEREEKTENKG